MMWLIILGVIVISLGITVWSILTAPLMPDDYGIKPEDIWPLDERPDTEEDANKEN
jgi:hypothetical protein|tara:strand:- start:314 stop:481 length:168 start_codon:yes stop_codon:yes gene_type:complete